MALVPRRTALVAALLAVALFASGCFSPAPKHVQDWQAELAAHGPTGLSASFDLSAARYFVTGDGDISQTSDKFWIAPSMPGWPGTPPYVYVETTVPAHGAGVVRLEGASMQVTGSVPSIPVSKVEGREESVRLTLREDIHHPDPAIAWSEPQYNESRDLFHADAVVLTATGLTFTGFDRAVLYTLAGDEVELTGPLTLDVEALFVLRHTLLAFPDTTLTADYARFGWAGEATAGKLTTEANVGLPRPNAVFGDDATLTLGPGNAKSVGDFRLTQAVGPDGPLIESQVQVQRTEPGEVELVRGQASWVRYDYREHAYEGAAIAKSVRVTGTGKDLVTVRMEPAPTILEQMLDIIPTNDPWAGSVVALGVVLTSPAIIFLDAILAVACAFSTCPEQYPYPMWMEPGEIGTFYVEVSGDVPVGMYEAEIHIEGANHDPVTLPLAIRVVDGPASPATTR